jgi:hypothetical protein
VSRASLLSAVFLALFFAAFAPAQSPEGPAQGTTAVLQGTITDAHTNASDAGAIVTWKRGEQIVSGLTDEVGHYVFLIPILAHNGAGSPDSGRDADESNPQISVSVVANPYRDLVRDAPQPRRSCHSRLQTSSRRR